MTRAEILRAKVSKRIEERSPFKFDIIESNYETRAKIDDKRLVIEEVFRHNGTSENCSIRIIVDKVDDWGRVKGLYNSGKITEKASNRVINDRIDKALEKFVYSDPEPFTMDMLDAYYQ